MPMNKPPIAGHHIQWSGTRWNKSSNPYTISVTTEAPSAAIRPTTTQKRSQFQGSAAGCAGGNSGPAGNSTGRTAAATAAEVATGIRLLGFHSNNSTSTARSVAATGVPKIAD